MQATWVRVDTRFPTHRKVLEIGPLAEALWLRGLCYAGDHLTDGAVPGSYVRKMGDLDGPAEAARLVAAGLWSQDGDGWRIHAYLDWQRSKDEAADISAKRAEAGRRGGKQKASNLLAGGGDPKQTPSKLPSKSLAKPRQTPSKLPPEPGENLGEPSKPSKPLAEQNRAETEQTGETPRPPPPEIQPWDLFVAVCAEIGADPAGLTETEKAKQLRAGKQLVAAGLDAADVRRLVRWLAGQDWVTKGGGIDLRLLAGQAGKWVMQGKPDGVTAIRGSPSAPGTIERGGAPKDGGLAAWKASGKAR